MTDHNVVREDEADWVSSSSSEDEDGYPNNLPPSSPLPPLSSSPMRHASPLDCGTLPSPFQTPRRPPRSSQAPTSGPIMSTPIRGRTQKEKQLARKAKNAKLTSQRMTMLHASRRAPLAPAATMGQHPHEPLFQRILGLLRKNKASFAGLVFYVLDPVYKQGFHRFHGFLRDPKNIDRLFSLMGRKSRIIRERVQTWARGLVTRSIRREARLVTSTKQFQTHHRSLGGSFFVDFSFARVKARLAELMPTTTAIFSALASNPKYAPKHGPARQTRRSNVIFTSILQGLSEWSQKNNLLKKVFGLYMYATGSQRQQIEVLSHIGLTETYSTLVDKKGKNKKKKAKRPAATSPPAQVTIEDVEAAADETKSTRPGTLRQLSEDMKAAARSLAESILFGGTYDNVNVMSRVAEQIVGRTGKHSLLPVQTLSSRLSDAQENGTCATIFGLWKAALPDMKAQVLLDAFDAAGPLELDDILHNESEAGEFREHLIFTILRVIVSQGGDSFKRFRSELSDHQPSTADKIELHKTEIQPTPAWKIDQSSITGNAEFVEVFYEYLGLRTSPEFSTWVRILIGDQLSIARLRSLLNIRARGARRSTYSSHLSPLVGTIGEKEARRDSEILFWSPDSSMPRLRILMVSLQPTGESPGPRIGHPGAYGTTTLCYTACPLPSPPSPPFRTCRDLIWVSLYARVLDCLLLVTGKPSIEAVVTRATTFQDLLGFATSIYDRFVDVDLVADLRSERRFATERGMNPELAKKGDMVFENATLFLRDALISREFADAIKCGDSGRVMLVLKVWALSYRGSGRTKYAYEMLSLIHHIAKVWPQPIVKIVFNNWLVNTTGHPNSFLEGDLLQEHMNFWIKTFYRAHGSNASWAWLEMVAPCVVVLRNLTRSLNGLLGADLGTKHKSPDLTKDIAVLMSRLHEYEVHTLKRGRVIGEDDGGATTDIISAGLATLSDSSTNPLDDYNAAFKTLQRRCKQPVLVPEPPASPPAEPVLHTRADPPQSVDTPMPAPPAVEEDPPEEGDEEEHSEDESVDEEQETLTLETQEDVELEMDSLGGESEGESDASDDGSSDAEEE
ncbi:hypothetical protein MKEN_00695600 [Mycena kentingensis (nom. inval.)]|nr:hypothetical protein MKEN_00695600 [Mycena kentingensis (nom. inval.)]